METVSCTGWLGFTRSVTQPAASFLQPSLSDSSLQMRQEVRPWSASSKPPRYYLSKSDAEPQRAVNGAINAAISPLPQRGDTSHCNRALFYPWLLRSGSEALINSTSMSLVIASISLHVSYEVHCKSLHRHSRSWLYATELRCNNKENYHTVEELQMCFPEARRVYTAHLGAILASTVPPKTFLTVASRLRHLRSRYRYLSGWAMYFLLGGIFPRRFIVEIDA